MIRNLVVILVLSLVLTGCTAAPAAPATPAKADPLAGKTFYWLAVNNSNAFYVQGLKGWRQAAADLGVKAEFVGPLDANLAEQMKTLEQLVAKPDTGGILFYAMDFNAAKPLVDEAVAKGIPFVMGNTDSPYKSRDGFVGTDHVAMGNQAAAYTAKLLNCQGTVGGVGNNSVVVPLRIDTFLKQMKALCPNIKTVQPALYNGSTQEGVQTLEALLTAHPELSLVWYADGTSADSIAAYKEKRQAGQKTLFLGADMPDAAMKAVADGTWVGTMAQDTTAEEYWSLQLLVAKAKGVPIPDSVGVHAMLITQDNVAQYMGEKK